MDVDLKEIQNRIEKAFDVTSIQKFGNCALWSILGTLELKKLGIESYSFSGDLTAISNKGTKFKYIESDNNNYHVVTVANIKEQFYVIDFSTTHMATSESSEDTLLDRPLVFAVNNIDDSKYDYNGNLVAYYEFSNIKNFDLNYQSENELSLLMSQINHD